MTEQKKYRENLPIKAHMKTFECLGKNIQSMTFDQLREYAKHISVDAERECRSKLSNDPRFTQHLDDILIESRELRKRINDAEGLVLYRATLFWQKLSEIQLLIEKQDG